MFKPKNLLKEKVSQTFKNGDSFERLAFFVFMLLLMAHFMSCTFIFIARLEFDEPNWIACSGMEHLDSLDIYWAA